MKRADQERDDLYAIVMAKLPDPGRVKTRLIPPLSPEQAAAVHGLFLRHLLDMLQASVSALGIEQVVLCYDPPASEMDSEYGYSRGDPDGMAKQRRELMSRHIACRPQAAGDLGDRLVDAHQGIARTSLFLGADSPDVPVLVLEKAFRLLRNGHELVLGPCEDGGFWCLGVAAGVNLRPVVRGVAWSSGQEMAQVRRNAESAGLSVALADPWWDVDHPVDLANLLDRLAASPDGTPLRNALLEVLGPEVSRALRAGCLNPETS